MYEIFTDTAANLDCSLLEELGVELIPFSFYYNGEEAPGDQPGAI